jgi:hypothetical protein
MRIDDFCNSQPLNQVAMNIVCRARSLISIDDIVGKYLWFYFHDNICVHVIFNAVHMGYGPFSLCVIYNEGLSPCKGNINRLMMMKHNYAFGSVIIISISAERRPLLDIGLPQSSPR